MELGLDVGGGRLLLEQLVLQPHADAGEVGFGGAQQVLRVERLLLHTLVAQLQNLGVRFDDGAGQREDPLDAPIGGRGDPADVLGHQRAGAAHLAEHRAPLDGVGPHRAELHGRRRRLQLRETDGHEHEHEQAGDRENGASDAFLTGDGRAGNVHDLLWCARQNSAARVLSKVKPCATGVKPATTWT